ncbi:ABC transporter ATP-binding protein [Mesorhizobium sp. B2-3-4]|uniref:ABC transporter ATP-binding protein n=1 Tax=Mesorhizobium sp. B2-3-4 TaxID=2589959 RepID=UPI001AEED6DB|nr:ABC transporter ATP-binding protein [Mesorhizobium sp. B2-3-4]
MEKPLVQIRNLELSAATGRGEARILRSIDLDIERGSILGIVGESGSGKSSLANAIIGLPAGNTSKLSGEIVLDGVNLLSLDESGMRALRGSRVAMVFQDPMTALNPLFSVERHLVDVIKRRFPAVSRADATGRALAALEAVGIADPGLRLASYPGDLSGGMRQRVLIAMALLAEPDLLIADEPTTALDATIEAQIVSLLSDLKARLSGSILFISHHLGLVARLCERICVMYGGTVVELGDTAAIAAAPAHPYTRALMACMIDDQVSDAPLMFIPGEVPDPVAPVQGCIFAPRCAHVVEQCLRVAPQLRDLGASRKVACHRAGEIA